MGYDNGYTRLGVTIGQKVPRIAKYHKEQNHRITQMCVYFFLLQGGGAGAYQ